MTVRSLVLGAALALLAPALQADEVSLRLGGKEIELSSALRERMV